MTCDVVLAAVVLACSPCAPAEEGAELVDGWWWVTLANGTRCMPRPFQPVIRETDAQASRSATRRGTGAPCQP